MIDNESGEDYLEAVLRLSATKKDVHAVEVSRELGVSKPAVAKAMRILTQKGYVEIRDNHIRLTERGREYAESVFEKHKLLTAFLVKLGVDVDTAEADACRMEHLVSEATYTAVKKFMQ